MDPKNQPVTQPGRAPHDLDDLQAQLAALPPNVTGEIIGGRLHVHPRPSPKHASAAGRLLINLSNAYQDGITGPGGWVFLHEVDLRLGNDPANYQLTPDISGWVDHRFPDHEWETKSHFTVPPDWVCEALSKRTEKYDRTEKLAVYAANGVKHCWYPDPMTKTLDVYILEGSVYGPPPNIPQR